MSNRRKHSSAIAGAKAGFSASTAYRCEKAPRLPSQKKKPRERRRPDPLAGVWESEVLPPAYAFPYQRFDAALADCAARLGADAGCYSFIVADFHHLLPAGFAGAPVCLT